MESLLFDARPAQHWADISVNGKSFVDGYGRTLMLRGINICGNSKLPTKSTDFFHHNDVSFIGRPFLLSEADEHFARLESWGLTLCRLLVPWEALEHIGPGIYDEEFIAYLRDILDVASNHGIRCFVDPHQDCFSRFTGGSGLNLLCRIIPGAPGWTFEVVGLDITKFKATGAAHVQQLSDDPESKEMLWPTNYTKLATATMFTVFFAGDIYCPGVLYRGTPIQQFLQSHFINAFKHLAKKLKGHQGIVGFEVMNEPHNGYIGLPDLKEFDQNSALHLGDMPNALESMYLANGHAQNVDYYVKSWPWYIHTHKFNGNRPSKKQGKRLINNECENAWIAGECLWKRCGLWGYSESGEPISRNTRYFATDPSTGGAVSFNQAISNRNLFNDKDCYLPFVEAYIAAIHSIDEKLLVFFEPVPNEEPPVMNREGSPNRLVYAPHWYDLKALFTKSFDGFITHDVPGLSKGRKNIITATYVGINGAKLNYSRQINNIVETGIARCGERPCLIGECGIPMDINDREAFCTGDYSHHDRFLDTVIGAMEANLVHFTLWNYNPANNHEQGDHWNGEDFSIYSPQPSPKLPRANKNEAVQEKSIQQIVSQKLKATRPKLTLDSKAIATHTRSSSGHERLPSTPLSPFEMTNAFLFGSDEGGRGLGSIIRPYAAKIAGVPIMTHFDKETLEFNFEKRVSSLDDGIGGITELFVPSYHYGDVKPNVTCSDGEWHYSRERQSLFWRVNSLGTHWIRIEHPQPPREKNRGVLSVFLDYLKFNLG